MMTGVVSVQPAPGTTFFPGEAANDDTPDAASASTPAVAGPDWRPGQPVGQKARWRILADAMEQMHPGHILMYETMGELLGLDHQDPAHKQAISLAARKASSELERSARMVFKVVRGHGYQCAQPSEVMGMVRRHQEKAMTEVGAAVQKVDAVDLSTLDSTTRKLFEVAGIALTQQQHMMGQLDVRQGKLERAMSALGVRQVETETRVEQLGDETQRKIAKLQAELNDLKNQQ